MKELPLVTVVVLNFNGRNYLERNLPSLLQLTYPNIRITVIDNASTDDSIVWVQRHYPSVKILRNKNNFGFAKGYNIGLEQIQSDYYLLINTDVEVIPSLLEPMVALLEKDKVNAVCQPKILSFENRTCFEYAGAAGGMMDKLGYPFARGRLFFTCEEDNNQYNDDIEIFWASGACFLIKAKCFWEINGFYDFFFMQHEETDLCWRLKLKGYKILYSGKSKVFHLGGAHLPYKSPRKTFLNFRNNWIMLYRNVPSRHFWLFIAPSRTLLDIIASFYFLYRSNFKSFLSIYRALWGFYGWLFRKGLNEKTEDSFIYELTAFHNRSIVFDYFIKGKRKFSDL